MRIYLDDERTPPEGWHLVSTPREAIECLQTGSVEEISLDHDLGDGPANGYQVILWIEEAVALRRFVPPKIRVHSANPSARQKMESGIRSICRLHNENLKINSQTNTIF
jgi:hypothetical protein